MQIWKEVLIFPKATCDTSCHGKRKWKTSWMRTTFPAQSPAQWVGFIPFEQHVTHPPWLSWPCCCRNLLKWQGWCRWVLGCSDVRRHSQHSVIWRGCEGTACQINHDRCSLSWALLAFPVKRWAVLRTLSLLERRLHTQKNTHTVEWK